MASEDVRSDDEYSVIGDKGAIGFIDFKADKSVRSFNPAEEAGPIAVSVPFPLVADKPRSVMVGDTAFDSITITNTTRETVDLWAVRIYASTPADSFTLSLLKPPSAADADADAGDVAGFLESFCMEDRTIQPRKTLTVWLSCKPKETGLHTTVVQFDSGYDRIERVVFLLADDRVSKALLSNRPYTRKPRRKKNEPVAASFAADQFVPGKRLAMGLRCKRDFKNELPLYPIPADVREAICSEEVPDAVNAGLLPSSYVPFFRTLVVMEELQLEEDMRSYDMECVYMKASGPLSVSLEVPGLAEKRPSLVINDHVFAKLAHGYAYYGDTATYEGFIHRVEADHVLLRFGDDFHQKHQNQNPYSIQFSYNRFNMRRLYQAIDSAGRLGEKFLFPSKSFGKRRIRTTPLVPISCTLNEEQMCSIEMILGCKGAPPYVIHGPPGTGKTMTLVEAILQLYKTRKNARILVCAPSNSAADHILEIILREKAVNVKGNELLRLNATSRNYDDINPNYRNFCYSEDCTFQIPPIQDLRRYRIVISTYMNSSVLYSEGIKQGHFSHIILDEAGQASEPETMIPISHLCRESTVVVLAGDPMQLGPIVFSKNSESHGLGRSYLERLFECDFYCDGDENYIMKLVRNYRCHPEILALPSQLFYNGELIACKDSFADSISDPWLDLLPSKDFPLLFVGVQGCDEREGTNPSWFNRIEVSKVVEIIKKLTLSKNLGENDIGVITPYRQQVQKIKISLERLDIPNIKVGSVEQFQGQEKPVIIISTVRSTIKHNEFDRTYCLGFLTNPRRFNVAITRARCLLIIIGNPHIISKDLYWNELLWHCSDNESYCGCGLPERKEFVPKDLMAKDYGNSDTAWKDYGDKVQTWKEYNNEEQTHDAYLNHEAGNHHPDEDVNWSRGGSCQVPKSVADEAEWSDGWRDDSICVNGDLTQKKFGSQYLRGKDNSNGNLTGKGSINEGRKLDVCLNHGEHNLRHPHENVECGQESFQEDPVTNEAEWSDGWRD